MYFPCSRLRLNHRVFHSVKLNQVLTCDKLCFTSPWPWKDVNYQKLGIHVFVLILTAGTSFLFFLFILLFSEKEDKLYNYYNALYKWSFVLKIFLHIKTSFPLLLFRNMFIPVCVCMYVHACVCVCGWGGGACVRVMFLDKNSDTNCQPVCRISTKGSCLDESCCVVYYKYTCLCGVL